MQGFFDLLSKEFSFIILTKKKLCPAKRNILLNIQKCARMPSFEETRYFLWSKLEKIMGILMEHSKMRKDASVLRNNDLKMKIVELDGGFHMVVSKVRKNVSS